ncbi:MAG TPA: hypothetical protein VF283_04375 [Bryobacteraceae bacterium]
MPTIPDDFAVILDNCKKLDLLDIESDLASFNPKIHVVDESEHRYGEPGTLILIALAGNFVLPPLLLWLAKHRQGFKISEQKETTLPGGETVKSSLKISVTGSALPSSEQLRELSKFPGVDPVKIAAAYGIHLPGSEESSR